MAVDGGVLAVGDGVLPAVGGDELPVVDGPGVLAGAFAEDEQAPAPSTATRAATTTRERPLRLILALFPGAGTLPGRTQPTANLR